MQPIILASSSPRRKDILSSLSIPFYAVNPPFEEIIPPTMPSDCVPEHFAVQKAQAVASILNNTYADALLIIGADTVINFENRLFGKAKNRDEAHLFLQTFSGSTHRILTGLSVYNRQKDKMLSCTSTNFVTFKDLCTKDIEWYLDSDEWMDAAGAYKVQGSVQRFISHMEGSYSSILGLPIFEFYDIIEKQGYVFS